MKKLKFIFLISILFILSSCGYGYVSVAYSPDSTVAIYYTISVDEETFDNSDFSIDDIKNKISGNDNLIIGSDFGENYSGYYAFSAYTDSFISLQEVLGDGYSQSIDSENVATIQISSDALRNYLLGSFDLYSLEELKTMGAEVDLSFSFPGEILSSNLDYAYDEKIIDVDILNFDEPYLEFTADLDYGDTTSSDDSDSSYFDDDSSTSSDWRDDSETGTNSFADNIDAGQIVKVVLFILLFIYIAVMTYLRHFSVAKRSSNDDLYVFIPKSMKRQSMKRQTMQSQNKAKEFQGNTLTRNYEMDGKQSSRQKLSAKITSFKEEAVKTINKSLNLSTDTNRTNYDPYKTVEPRVEKSTVKPKQNESILPKQDLKTTSVVKVVKPNITTIPIAHAELQAAEPAIQADMAEIAEPAKAIDEE